MFSGIELGVWRRVLMGHGRAAARADPPGSLDRHQGEAEKKGNGDKNMLAQRPEEWKILYTELVIENGEFGLVVFLCALAGLMGMS